MEHEHEMRASRVVGLGIAVAGGGEVEPEGPFEIKVESVVGVRLGPEALEAARRREEAAWASGAPSPARMEEAGRDPIDAWGFAARGEEEEVPRARRERSVFSGAPSFAGATSSDDLRGAARALRRAAEEDRARLAAAAAPLRERKRESTFEGEMLPEFLGRKPEAERR